MNTILKGYIVFMFFLLNINFANSQSILFDEDTLSFDTICENNIYNKFFYFKNISNKIICISTTFENCPCIMTSYLHEPIKPNERKYVEISISTYNRYGVFNKNINIQLCDGTIITKSIKAFIDSLASNH